MKKLLIVLLTLSLVFTFAACGGTSDGGNGSDGSGDNGTSGDFEWTRDGHFEDQDGNYLMIFKSEDEDYPDMWQVTAAVGDNMIGWYIPLEGETLHGDLVSEYVDDMDPFVVTISEEGEDGVLLVTEAGEQYHFTPMVLPETIGTLKIDTEGLGEIAYAAEGEELEFNEEYPTQSAFQNVYEGEGTTYVLAARPSEDGWKFVKWTKDGEDYSTDEQITVEVTGDAEYIAVFEFAEE